MEDVWLFIGCMPGAEPERGATEKGESELLKLQFSEEKPKKKMLEIFCGGPYSRLLKQTR